MKINKALNFVIPLSDDEGKKSYIHAMPISLEVFDEFAVVLGLTFSSIFAGGLGVASGPRLAYNLLREAAKRRGGEEEWARVQKGLVNEILRLTNVVHLTEKGWETLPFDDAVRQGRFDEEDMATIRNLLVFFTVNWRMHGKDQRVKMTQIAMDLWGGLLSSLNCTEYARSLPIPTETDNSGEKAE